MIFSTYNGFIRMKFHCKSRSIYSVFGKCGGRVGKWNREGKAAIKGRLSNRFLPWVMEVQSYWGTLQDTVKVSTSLASLWLSSGGIFQCSVIKIYNFLLMKSSCGPNPMNTFQRLISCQDIISVSWEKCVNVGGRHTHTEWPFRLQTLKVFISLSRWEKSHQKRKQ